MRRVRAATSVAPVLDPPSPATLPASFPETLAALYTQKYTGAVTLHFLQGVPTVAELPGPVTRIPLRQPTRT